MRKNFLIKIILLLFFSCLFLVCFSACNNDIHEHNLIEQVVLPTCTEQGYTIHKCECGEEYINNYINSLGHNYDTPTYTWNGDKCTATRTCLNDSNHVQTETVIGVYVKDTEATCFEYEKGHWQAVFINNHFTTQTTSENSVENLDSFKHSFSNEWTYDINYHWHGAVCEHTSEVKNKAEHTYINYVCSACGFIDESKGLKLKLNDDGISYSIIGIKYYSTNENELNIPETCQGKPITSISHGAFRSFSHLTSVIIGNNITSIGDSAFENCSKLTNLIMSDSVTQIGNDVFKNCPIEKATIPTIAISRIKNNDLKEVIITSGTTIGKKAFQGCTLLTKVTMSDNVTLIGGNAFENCTSLSNIKTSKNIVSISDGAFLGCVSLVEFVVPNSVLFMGKNIFTNCSSLKYNEFGNGLYLGNDNNPYLVLIKAKNIEISVYTLHDECKFILENAFSNCSKIVEATIPNSVTYIGDSAFAYCHKLENVSIGKGIISVGRNIFKGCTSLVGVTMIESGACIIGQYGTFEGCTSLQSITIGNNVTHIGQYVFKGCSSLLEIVIPDSVTSIGYGAFSYCSSLKSVTIGANVTSIDEFVFNGCTSLLEITIPKNVESIGAFSFQDCNSLKNIKFEDTTYWYRVNYINFESWQSKNGGIKEDLSSSSTNAIWFITPFRSYHWYKI